MPEGAEPCAEGLAPALFERRTGERGHGGSQLRAIERRARPAAHGAAGNARREQLSTASAPSLA
jgi:hypothetical protein